MVSRNAVGPLIFALSACLCLLCNAPAFAVQVIFTSASAYNAAAITTGIMTFNGQSGVSGATAFPFYTEGSASLHGYFTTASVPSNFGFIKSPSFHGASFDGTDYYYSFAGDGPNVVPPGTSYGYLDFTTSYKVTAAGVSLASFYKTFYGPTFDFTADVTLFDGVNPVFTATGYSFPGFFNPVNNYGFLGVCSSVPFDGFRITTYGNANASYVTADNFVYGRKAASAVPEPGIFAFGLITAAALGGLCLCQRAK